MVRNLRWITEKKELKRKEEDCVLHGDDGLFSPGKEDDMPKCHYKPYTAASTSGATFCNASHSCCGLGVSVISLTADSSTSIKTTAMDATSSHTMTTRATSAETIPMPAINPKKPTAAVGTPAHAIELEATPIATMAMEVDDKDGLEDVEAEDFQSAVGKNDVYWILLTWTLVRKWLMYKDYPAILGG